MQSKKVFSIRNEYGTCIDERVWDLSYTIRDMINQKSKILLIVGPSGSGKSTLSNYIVRKGKYELMKIYTTRENRNNTLDNNTICISKEEFQKKSKEGFFFLNRMGIEPYYGYSSEDFLKIINKGKKPIFMFRNHGLRFLLNNIYNMDIIFITGNPEEIVFNSQSVNPYFSVRDIQEVLDNNLQLYNKAYKQGIKVYTINNNFDKIFFDDADKLALW